MSRTDFQSDCEWNPIEGGIADGKMRHYLNAAHQDKKVAAQMFHLDGAVAASFLEPIRLVELVLREAIHQNMTQVYGSRWMHQEEAGSGQIDRPRHQLHGSTEEDHSPRNSVVSPHRHDRLVHRGAGRVRHAPML